MTLRTMGSLGPRGLGSPAPIRPDLGFADAIGPALTTGSDIVAPFFAEHSRIGTRDRRIPYDFDPLADIAGYEGDAEIFLQAESAEEVIAIKRELDRRRDADRVIGAAGWGGVGAELAAGAVSPTMLLPGGAIARGVAGGVSVARTAGSAALYGGLAASVSEAALAASQSSYHADDVLLGIGAGTLFPGLLGGAAGVFARSQAISATRRPTLDPQDLDGVAAAEAEADAAAAAMRQAEEAFEAARTAGGRAVEADAPDLARLRSEREAAVRAHRDARGRVAVARRSASDGAAELPEVMDATVGERARAYRPDGTPETVTVTARPGAGRTEVRTENGEVVVLGQDAALDARDPTSPSYGIVDGDGRQAVSDIAEAELDAAIARVSGEMAAETGADANVASICQARLQRDLTALNAEKARRTNGGVDDPVQAEPTIRDLQATWRTESQRFADELRMPEGTAGAQAARSLDAASEDLVPSLGAARAARWIDDPVAHLQQSQSVTARRLATELAESALRQKKNADGAVTTADSVQSRIRKWDGRLYRVIRNLDREYLQHRGMKPGRGDALTEGKVVWSMAADRLRGREDGALSYVEFKRAVGDAMRAGDAHAVPEVARAAKFTRETLFNPARDDAIELGMLGEDVATAADADRYLTRAYNTAAIVQQRNEFVEVVADWLEQEQATKLALQGRADGVIEEVRVAKADVSKAERRQANAVGRIERIEAAIAEQALAGRRATTRAEILAGRQQVIDDEIADIQAQIDEMREAGRVEGPEVRALEREASALRQARRRALPTERQNDLAESSEAGAFIASDPVLAKAFGVIGGRRKAPKLRTIIDDLTEIGVRDDGGELAALGVTNTTRPGLFRRKGLNLEDEAGERLTEMGYHGVDPQDRSVNVRDAILDMVRRTLADDPVISPRAGADDVALAEYVAVLQDAAGRAGADLSTPVGFHRFVAGLVDRPDGAGRVSLEDLDSELADMEAAGTEAIEPAADVGAVAEARGDALRRLRSAISASLVARSQKVARRRRGRLQAAEQSIEGRAQRSRADVLSDRLLRAEAHAEEMSRLVARRQGALDAARNRAEDIAHEWKGARSSEAKSALKARQKAEEDRSARLTEQGRDPEAAARLSSADKAVETALRRIVESHQDLDRVELIDIAEQIANRIISTPDGRLTYDRIEGGDGGYAPRQSNTARGPQRYRVFGIPDDFVSTRGFRFDAYLENDVEMLSHMYTRTMGPDIELTRRFGRPEDADGEYLIAQLRSVELEYQRMTQATEDPAELAKLERQRQSDLRAIRGIRDRLRGTYALPANPQGWAYRATNVILNLNLIRLLGGVTLASIPDVGHAIAHNGFSRSGLAPALRAMTSAEARLRMGDELRTFGTAADIVIGGRMQAIADLSLQFHRLSRFERGLQGFTGAFGRVSLMSYWNIQAKTLVGMLTMARVAPAVRDLAAGRAHPKDVEKLASVGIDGPLADRMARQLDRYGEDVDGVVLPNLERWDDVAAADHLGGVLAAEADRAIVTPGMEKPLFASQQSMRLIMQFRSFVMSAQTRILASKLQQRDAQALFGAVVMVGLGSLSYATRQWLADREVSDDWSVILREGVDRSGLLAVVGDAHNTIEKTTGLGASMAFGGPQASRYYSRNTLGAILGPTAGAVGDLALAMGMARSLGAEGELEAHQIRALRRLVPLQNLFWLRWAFDHLEEGAQRAVR